MSQSFDIRELEDLSSCQAGGLGLEKSAPLMGGLGVPELQTLYVGGQFRPPEEECEKRKEDNATTEKK